MGGIVLPVNVGRGTGEQERKPGQRQGEQRRGRAQPVSVSVARAMEPRLGESTRAPRSRPCAVADRARRPA